jgi:hypothetical protein
LAPWPRTNDLRIHSPACQSGGAPVGVPKQAWSLQERRFLKAAFKAAEAIQSWWLETQAIFLERNASDDNDD